MSSSLWVSWARPCRARSPHPTSVQWEQNCPVCPLPRVGGGPQGARGWQGAGWTLLQVLMESHPWRAVLDHACDPMARPAWGGA